MTLGLVCDVCDALSPLGVASCGGCGEPLGIAPVRSTAPLAAGQAGESAVIPAPPAALISTATPASGICNTCGGDVAPGFRFCGHCGATIAARPPSSSTGGGSTRAADSGIRNIPARLVLIKGEGVDGIAYPVDTAPKLAGRLAGDLLFPEDPLLSPRHATFFHRDGRLVVRDEGSRNGIFVRIRAPLTIDSGSTFLVGEQLLRIDSSPPERFPTADGSGTYFYGSPRRPARLSVVQVLAGGDIGMVFRVRAESVTIGRESNDINFPDDPFISSGHVLLRCLDGDKFLLTDVGSKNGTFLRVQHEATLQQGDLLFIGQQLLRVEIRPA